MNQTVKRSMALLMALIMCIGLLPALHLNADAADYVYNWGTRGTTATSLSDAAKNFYTGDNTYERLSQLKGSTSTSSVPSSALYTELQDLMVSKHKTQTSYDGTRELYQYTDCQNGGGKISSFYSGAAVGPTWDGSFNREHTWPNSKGLEGNDENDIMMLRPTSYAENTSRGNTAYGEGDDYYDPNDESKGAYNLHGDVARIMLYVYVRWGNTNLFGTSGVMESKEILLKWMAEDPVDTWEMGRNDSVQSITGTRNVFVDYPELAFLLFDAEVPAIMVTPSGAASGCQHSFTSAVTTEPTCDENGVRTYTCGNINCGVSYTETIKATGHSFVDGICTVCNANEPQSTSATLVTNVNSLQEGDRIIIVTATLSKALGATQASNNRPAVDVTKDGNTVSYGDDVQIITLEAGTVDGTYAFNVGDGYLYAAGSDKNYLRTQTTNDANGSWKIEINSNGVATIKAQGTNTRNWMRYNTQYAIFNCYSTGQEDILIYELSSSGNTGGGSGGSPEQPEQPEQPETPAGSIANGDKVVIYNPANNKALSSQMTGNYSKGVTITITDGVMTGYADTEVFTVTVNEDGSYTFSNGGKNFGMQASYNSTSMGSVNDKWALTDLGNGLYLIKNTVRGTYLEWYASKNNWSTYTDANAATNPLYQQSFYIVEKGNAEPELPECTHTNTKVEGAVAATCTTDGHTGKTVCSDCGETISEGEEIPATGHNYVDGACTVCGEADPDAPEQPKETLTDGNRVVIWAPGYKKALSTQKTGNYNKGINVTETDGNLFGYGETEIFTLIDNGDGTWSFEQGGKKLIINKGYSSLGMGSGDDKWTLTDLGDGLYLIRNKARQNYLEWYAQYSNFSTYNSTNAATDKQFQMKFYLVVEPDGCKHEYAAVVTEPTCAKPGYTTYTCPICKDSYVGDEVPATGEHNYEAVVTPPICMEGGYTTYTCTVCNDSYVGDEVPAIGKHSYEAIVTAPTCVEGGYTTYTCSVCDDSYVADETAPTGVHLYENGLCTGCGAEDPYATRYNVHFVVPTGVEAVDSTTCGRKGITLPAAGTVEGYTFVGWVAVSVNNVTEEPKYMKAGDTFTTEGDMVLYALYTYETEVEGRSSEPALLVTFNLGANTAESNKDNNSATASKTYTEGDYKFAYTNGSKVYPDSYDAKGDCCIKFGTKSVVGSLTFTVPEDVTSVVLYLAKYKANTSKCDINGTVYTLTKSSNDSQYDQITVDTTTNKTVTVKTVSGGVRMMMSRVDYYGSNTKTETIYTTVIGDACVHEAKVVDAKAPDCVNTGSTGKAYCALCDKNLTTGYTIDALGHDMVIDEAVAPSCTATGLTEGAHCSRCDDATVAQEVIPATGDHPFGAWKTVKAAGCAVSGMRTRECVCGASQTEVIPATGVHTYGAWTETKAATCTEAGEKTRTCDCGDVQTATIAALGHTEVIDAAVAATCTAAGKTEGKRCSACNEVLTAQEEIPAKGHMEVSVAGKPATHTVDGLSEGKRCAFCNEVLTAQETIPATGHSFGEWKVRKAATTEAEGEEMRMCSCGETETRTTEKLQSNGVNPVVIVAAVVVVVGAGAAAAFVFLKKKRA